MTPSIGARPPVDIRPLEVGVGDGGGKGLDGTTVSTPTRRWIGATSDSVHDFKAAVVERGPGLLQPFLPQSATEAAHFRWRGMLPAGRVAQALREETIFVATSRFFCELCASSSANWSCRAGVG